MFPLVAPSPSSSSSPDIDGMDLFIYLYKNPGFMIFIYTGGSIAVAPVYYSQLFVHKESPYVCIQDLQDSIFAYNDESSLSGFHCMIFFLKALGSQDKSIRLPFFSSKAQSL